MKVSFFGPFYGSYAVFELGEENYQYAFVSGDTGKYLRLPARSPTVSGELVERFVNRSSRPGFDAHGLIFVEHNQPDAGQQQSTP